MCMSLITSRCFHVEESILSRDTMVHLKCALVFFYPSYNKGFLDLQLKFVSQAITGTPYCGIYKLLIALYPATGFSLVSLC